jgi:hypothetical protein
MTDDITHDLGIVREALQAEGLINHVKLIDTVIEDAATLRIERDKWHRLAMEAGVVVCRDGGYIFAVKERADRLEAQIASARKALEPFAADVGAVSLSKALGHISREHLLAAKAALSDEQGHLPAYGEEAIKQAANEAAPGIQLTRRDGDFFVYYSGFNLSKFVRFLAFSSAYRKDE